MCDLLRGSPPDCNGLICLLTGLSGDPLLGRAPVLLAVSLFVAAPLLLLRCAGGLMTPLLALLNDKLLLPISVAGRGIAYAVYAYMHQQ